MWLKAVGADTDYVKKLQSQGESVHCKGSLNMAVSMVFVT